MFVQSVGGRTKVEIEAKDIRELFRKLAEQYPEPLIDRAGFRWRSMG
ncbi:hypothetical protein [Mesorhizobium sp. B2-3-5]|nr:hypothetical protein [Mesorhizobium sp. B2-3-5]